MRFASSRLSTPSVCSATKSAFERLGHDEDPRATLNETSGGVAPSEVTDVAVKPTGVPSGLAKVKIETPEACSRKLAFRASTGFWRGVDSFIFVWVKGNRTTL
jgi:hypothetical protein